MRMACVIHLSRHENHENHDTLDMRHHDLPSPPPTPQQQQMAGNMDPLCSAPLN
jgi:hypothetical protein